MNEKIAGYRELTPGEIHSINVLKDFEGKTGYLLAEISKEISADGNAQRWLSLAYTHLEIGFMFAIKAVARPSNGLGRQR